MPTTNFFTFTDGKDAHRQDGQSPTGIFDANRGVNRASNDVASGQARQPCVGGCGFARKQAFRGVVLP